MTNREYFSVLPAISYRLFYPQVPAIVCAKYRNEIAAMPANSCISLSNSPALVGVAVRSESKTARLLSSSKNFSLSWLTYSKKAEKYVDQLSSKSPPEPNKLTALGIPYKTVEGVPVITEAIAFLICHKYSVKRYGDHTLFVGRVKSAKSSRDFSKDNYWRFKEYKPMLYLGSNKKDPFTTL